MESLERIKSGARGNAGYWMFEEIEPRAWWVLVNLVRGHQPSDGRLFEAAWLVAIECLETVDGDPYRLAVTEKGLQGLWVWAPKGLEETRDKVLRGV